MQTEPYAGIYTIGYGTLELERWVSLLKQLNIQYLIDVRSRPFSSYRPEFSKSNLAAFLANHKIKYVFMGDKLGGQPEDEECYDKDGRVIYSKCETRPNYISGIRRIETNLKGNIRLCLMCAEGKPEECHRSKLIGETLFRKNIGVWHILHNGKILSQIELRAKIGKSQMNMFGETLTSRRKYNAKSD